MCPWTRLYRSSTTYRSWYGYYLFWELDVIGLAVPRGGGEYSSRERGWGELHCFHVERGSRVAEWLAPSSERAWITRHEGVGKLLHQLHKLRVTPAEMNNMQFYSHSNFARNAKFLLVLLPTILCRSACQ